MTAHDLSALLQRHRIPLTTERATQDAIEEILGTNDISFVREHSLGGFGRIDFLVGRCGLEVKIAHVSSPREVHRQLVRYLRSPELDALVLATGRTVMLPVLTKPVLVVALGRAWL